MAINQQPFSQSILPQTQNVTTGSGLTTLASTTSALSQIITERINQVAIDEATTQGALDVLNDKQPEKLALPFTKATRAYNRAVADTEARRQTLSAKQLISESLQNNTNPATFTPQTPLKFKAELEGIRSGILQHTRDETRAQVSAELDRMESEASLSMLQHSIDYDNSRIKFDMQKDITGLLEARRNAAIAGDEARLAGIDAAIESSIADYSTMNQEIKQIAPYLKDDIQKHKEIDSALAGYTHSLSNGSTSHYLSELAENKQNLPFNVWQDSVKAVVALDQEHKKLKNDINAEQWAQVQLGVNNGSIQDASDILNYTDLTVPQQLTAMRELDTIQAKKMKQGSEIITAQQNILSGHSTWNSADMRNKMFQSAIQTMEQSTKQAATLQDMEASVLGINDYPASGMPQTSIGANVPAFDATLQAKLTSNDPIQTAQAAMVYNDMVNIRGNPNSVNLTGDALAVATLFNTLNNGGTPPDQAAQQAIDSVLHAKEPEIAQRIDRFHRTLEHVNPYDGSSKLQNKFKEVFGSSPQIFNSDEAFNLFKTTYRANYISSNSEEAALNATKYAMRAWGTSKYFDKGYIGQPVPEKELLITNIGNAFGNQMVANLQGFINRTNAAREANPELNIPVIEWADPKQTVSGTETETDKVFKKMMLGDRPRIKINGHETDVVLIPSASSRLGERIHYLFGVYDEFNNLHPLQDLTNAADQVARFSPQDLSVWAPSIATKKMDEELRKIALDIQQKEMGFDTKKHDRQEPLWLSMLGVGKPDIYHTLIEERERQKSRTTEGRLEKIIDSLKGKSQSVRDEIAEADNVGISIDLEPRR